MEIKTQKDINECGLVIAQALHHHFYDKWININDIKHEAKINSKGITINNLKTLSKKYGVILEAFKGSWESYIKSKNVGFVITTIEIAGENHYIFFRLGKKKVEIVDPIKGSYKMDILEFGKKFSGVIITFEKGEYKKQVITKKFTLKFLLKNPILLTWILITIVASLILTMSSTVFMKIIFDTIIPGRLNHALNVLTFGFLWIALLRVLNTFFKKYFIKKFQLNIETKFTLEYFEKLRNGRYLELTKISQSDHLRRISLIEGTSSFLANSIFILFSEILNFVMAISFLVWLNPPMFGIALAAGGGIALTTTLVQYWVKMKYSDLLENQLKFLNTSMDHVFSFDANKEPIVNLKFKRSHEKCYKNYKETEFSIWKYVSLNVIISEFINISFPIVLTYVGVEKIFSHEITTGTMMMFLSLFHWFIKPIESISSLIINFKRNMDNYNMINFILNIKSESFNEKGLDVKDIKRLTLNDYEFGYDKKLFKIIWFEIKENVHIKGDNGSGKSTILKILANRIKGQGDYSINGTELEFYNLNSINEKIFYLNSNPYMPEGTIFEYITLNSPDAIERFNNSLRDFGLGKLFKELDLSLDSIIQNNGSNLSSGQKQLISIMRLFSFDYQVIILDEALENIDFKKVQWLSKALPQKQDAIFIEVSHSKKYLLDSKEVDIEEIISDRF